MLQCRACGANEGYQLTCSARARVSSRVRVSWSPKCTRSLASVSGVSFPGLLTKIGPAATGATLGSGSAAEAAMPAAKDAPHLRVFVRRQCACEVQDCSMLHLFIVQLMRGDDMSRFYLVSRYGVDACQVKKLSIDLMKLLTFSMIVRSPV